MKLFKFICFVLFIIILLSLNVEAMDRKNILVLNSYHIGMEWEDEVLRGIIEVFSESPMNLELFVEYLDTKRYLKEEARPLVDFLVNKKYKNLDFDIIIAVDDNALEYVIEKELYKKSHVIFVGINSNSLAVEASNNYGMTGVVEVINLEKTVRLMLQLHPKADTVLAISDSVSGLEEREEVFNNLPNLIKNKNIKYELYKDWSFEDLTHKMLSLKSNVVVLQLSFHKDINGESVHYNKPHEFFRKFNVPIYTLWKSHGIDQGLVGGYVAHGYAHGSIVAGMAIDVLRGVNIKNIPLQINAGNYPIFDYDILKKFNISRGRLPLNSIIINEPTSFYEKHYTNIWMFICFVFLGIVATLVIFIINQDRNRITSEYKQKKAEMLVLKHEFEKKKIRGNESCPNIDEVFDTLASVLHRIE